MKQMIEYELRIKELEANIEKLMKHFDNCDSEKLVTQSLEIDTLKFDLAAAKEENKIFLKRWQSDGGKINKLKNALKLSIKQLYFTMELFDGLDNSVVIKSCEDALKEDDKNEI